MVNYFKDILIFKLKLLKYMEILFLIVGLLIGAVAVWFIASSKFKGEAGRVEERSNMLEKEKSSRRILKSERQKVLDLSSKLSSLQSDYKSSNKTLEQKAEVEKLQEKFTRNLKILQTKFLKRKQLSFLSKVKQTLQKF